MTHEINTLSILHQNVQSLRNKIDQLDVELNLQNISIACFTESWLKSNELNAINLNGYTLSSSYCRNVYKNGGVTIFHKNSLNEYIREIPQICNLF